MIATGLYRLLLGHTNYLIRSDMSLGWNVRGVKCTWGETYVGWNVRGVKRTWGEMYVGWNVPGWNVPGWNVFGVKCHVTIKNIASFVSLSKDESLQIKAFWYSNRLASKNSDILLQYEWNWITSTKILLFFTSEYNIQIFRHRNT